MKDICLGYGVLDFIMGCTCNERNMDKGNQDQFKLFVCCFCVRGLFSYPHSFGLSLRRHEYSDECAYVPGFCLGLCARASFRALHSLSSLSS